MTIHQKHKSHEFFVLILQAPRELKAKYAFKIFGKTRRSKIVIGQISPHTRPQIMNTRLRLFEAHWLLVAIETSFSKKKIEDDVGENHFLLGFR